MRILVITGAGVSAESGIPTFRGKDGYWRNLDPTKLATPEAFQKNPELVWEWYRERRQRIGSANPNAAHHAIARLSTFTDEFLLVTQNVDNLHARAGMQKGKMVQIHGDIFATRCSRCEYEHPPSVAVATSGLASEDGEIPRCSACGALMRPGVIWFGEQLNQQMIEIVENFLDKGPCNFVIVAGTTAMFGYIIDWAMRARSSDGELIEVNPDETALSQFATRAVRKPAALALPPITDEIARFL